MDYRATKHFDFMQPSSLIDTIEDANFLTVCRAGFLAFGVQQLVRQADKQTDEVRKELDSQVITRADLRRWLEGRK